MNGVNDLSIFIRTCTNLVCRENLEGGVTSWLYSDHNHLITHEFVAEEAESYWFLLSAETFNTAGDFDFIVAENDVPTNDNCDWVISIDFNSLAVIFKNSTLGATSDFDELSLDTCGINLYTCGLWCHLERWFTVVKLEYKLYSWMNRVSDLSIFTGICTNCIFTENLEGGVCSKYYLDDMSLLLRKESHICFCCQEIYSTLQEIMSS